MSVKPALNTITVDFEVSPEADFLQSIRQLGMAEAIELFRLALDARAAELKLPQQARAEVLDSFEEEIILMTTQLIS